MKSSLFILAFFILGVSAGRLLPSPAAPVVSDWSLWALYLLLFLIGVTIGGDGRAWAFIRRVNGRILLVPLAIILGTLLGSGLVSLALNEVSLREALAVGAGFGYYSLSSVVIGQIHSQTLGVVALLANIMRELATLLLAPLLVRYFGRLAPIAAAGATAMDTTLPVISRVSGSEYALIAVVSGLILTVIVPVLVTFILTVGA